MAICKNCSKEIDDDSRVCGYCGCKTDLYTEQTNIPAEHKSNISIGKILASLLVPLAGLVFFLYKLQEKTR